MIKGMLAGLMILAGIVGATLVVRGVWGMTTPKHDPLDVTVYESWVLKVIDEADAKCGPVPFEVEAQRDGAVRVTCGRVESLGKKRVMKP